MKSEIISKLREFKSTITALKSELRKLETHQVSRNNIRNSANDIATKWVEELRSPLEHKYKIEKAVIDKTSSDMKQLHVLSRPNNLKSSYLKCLNSILKNFDDKFILPLQSNGGEITEIPELRRLIPGGQLTELSEYLTDAIACAENGFLKASIVLGWCAAIDIIQRKILLLGFDSFNQASKKIKKQNSGKYKRWNKEFSISTMGELQTVFDTDLIIVLEGMELIDGNQSQRLETCFQYRNHSAHPGEAPIEPAHVIAFFTDISKILLTNPNFDLL